MRPTLRLVDCQKSNQDQCKPLFRELTKREIAELKEYAEERWWHAEHDFWVSIIYRNACLHLVEVDPLIDSP